MSLLLTPTAFSKKLRLNNPVEFRQMFQAGKKLNTRYFGLYVKQNQLAYPRLGLILAKKTIRLAVMRNKFKRLIRENFRLHQQIITGFDVLVIAYPPINTLKRKEFREILEHQWAKLTSV